MQLCSKPGICILDFETTCMQFHDTVDQRQAQSASGLAAALVEPDKAALDPLPVGCGDTRSGITDLNGPAIGLRTDNLQSYCRHPGFYIAAVLDRVVEQVCHCLGHKLPVGSHQCGFRRVQNKRAAGLFRNGTIKLHQIVQQSHKISILEPFAHLAGFGTGDGQQGVERGEQAVRLGYIGFQRGFVIFCRV